MTAPILDLADEVVSVVNDLLVANHCDPIADRQYNPIVNLKEMPELRCVVYPARNTSESDLTRKLRQHEFEVQVLVQAKLGPPNSREWNVQLDGLIGLVDTLAEAFEPAIDYREPWPIVLNAILNRSLRPSISINGTSFRASST